ncbi:MAG: efflux transporter outer membrane subunit [Betaproteobacteria bacterium]|nr:efflux transporter outer membrane subunit [Betaproteobacteria bacterium]
MKKNLALCLLFLPLAAAGSTQAKAMDMMNRHSHALQPQTNARQAVPFPPMARAHFLANMRDHLQALSVILAAMASGNYGKAAAVANVRLGMNSPAASSCKAGGAHGDPSAADASDMEGMMAQFMPEKMRGIGLRMHQAASAFAAAAAEAGRSGDPRPAYRALAHVTQQCAACHAAYRVQSRSKRQGRAGGQQDVTGPAMRTALSLLSLLPVLLGGCAAGPDFVPPAAPTDTGYLPARIVPRLAASAGREPAQYLVEAQGVPSAWWRVFHSAALDKVVAQAMAGNPSIAASDAALAQARQAVRQVQGGYWPQVDVAASLERQRGPASFLIQQPGRSLPTYTVYSVGPIVSFAPDVFGLTARGVEQSQALAENQRYQWAAARLAVTGNTVLQALSIASVREQIGVIRALVSDDEKTLSIVRGQEVIGRASHADTLAAEAQLANDRALLPPLRQQLALAEDALAVLVGKPPADWMAPAFKLNEFTLPARLPLTLPSTLVRQRPDILAAEAELRASSAAIGVATAQMFPNFPLSASVATASLSTTALFGQSSVVWTLAAGLIAPIFHGGALEARKQGAIDGFRATLALYRQTVLQAFGQVADVLRALGHDTEWALAEGQAFDAARSSLQIERLDYEAGRTDLLHLLEVQRTYQEARLGYVHARVQRYVDSAQLFVSLGGGQVDATGGVLSRSAGSEPAASRRAAVVQPWRVRHLASIGGKE